jgi:hypothetical protein
VLPMMPRFRCGFAVAFIIAMVLATLPGLSALGSPPALRAVQPATPVASLEAHGFRIRDAAHRTVRRSGHANSFRRWNSSAVIGMYSRGGAVDTFVWYLCSNLDGPGRYSRIIK